MKVMRTTKAAGLTLRSHTCPGCRERWETAERVTRRLSLSAISSTPVAYISPTERRQVADPVMSSLSGSDLDLLSGLQSNPDPERAPVSVTRRKKRTFGAYSQEFEVLWAGIVSNRSKGLKSEAYEAWIAADRPPCIMLLGKWREYIASLGETFAKDVCRWIKKGGHLETYAAAPLLPAKPEVDTRPAWQRELAAQGQRERQASARYHDRQAQEKSACGYHLYRGEDKRFVLEECPKTCTQHGRDLDGNKIAVR